MLTLLALSLVTLNTGLLLHTLYTLCSDAA